VGGGMMIVLPFVIGLCFLILGAGTYLDARKLKVENPRLSSVIIYVLPDMAVVAGILFILMSFVGEGL
jgi:hypothetical protein